MKVRYHRRPGPADVRDYDVQVQDRPRGQWVNRGLVSRFGTGSPAWAALGASANAWTEYRPSRGEAVRDMLAGRTFRDPYGLHPDFPESLRAAAARGES